MSIYVIQVDPPGASDVTSLEWTAAVDGAQIGNGSTTRAPGDFATFEVPRVPEAGLLRLDLRDVDAGGIRSQPAVFEMTIVDTVPPPPPTGIRVIEIKPDGDTRPDPTPIP